MIPVYSKSLLRLAALCMLCVSCFFAGGIVTVRARYPAPPLRVVADESPPSIPVVHIEGIRNSALIGSVHGQVRLVARGLPVSITQSGTFAVHDATLLTDHIVIDLPPGMHYVASKRGQKYYDVASAQASRIVPENRVYFPTREAAEKAGYRR